MVDIGIEKVKKKNLDNKIFLMLGDAMNIPAADKTFDITTISFGIRNFSDPQKSLHDIYRVLKKDGRVMIMEFAIPSNPIVRAVYFFYFRHFLPRIGNLISKHKDAYTYLNKSVEDFPYGDQFLGLMKNAGFKNLKKESLTFGIAMLYVGDKLEE
jgi:demethylmenaquinone methyltransferase/2-methoxy-6-polyprenyl-1,4-benzoquinol methylase